MLLLRLCSPGSLVPKLAAHSSALRRSCLSLLLQLHLCQHATLCLRIRAFSLHDVLTLPLAPTLALQETRCQEIVHSEGANMPSGDFPKMQNAKQEVSGTLSACEDPCQDGTFCQLDTCAVYWPCQ